MNEIDTGQVPIRIAKMQSYPGKVAEESSRKLINALYGASRASKGRSLSNRVSGDVLNVLVRLFTAARQVMGAGNTQSQFVNPQGRDCLR
jgi:hypothetical protein